MLKMRGELVEKWRKYYYLHGGKKMRHQGINNRLQMRYAVFVSQDNYCYLCTR